MEKKGGRGEEMEGKMEKSIKKVRLTEKSRDREREKKDSKEKGGKKRVKL